MIQTDVNCLKVHDSGEFVMDTGSVFILEIFTDKQIIPLAFRDLENAKNAAEVLGGISNWQLGGNGKEQYWCADLDGMVNGVAIEAAQINEYRFYDNPVEFLKRDLRPLVFEEVHISDYGDVSYKREVEGQDTFTFNSTIPTQLRESMKVKLLNEGFKDFSSDGYGIDVRRWSYPEPDAINAVEGLFVNP